MKAIAIVSGGMDSITMAHLLARRVDRLHIISFDYGQRHVKELEYARQCARDLRAQFERIDLSTLRPLLSGSALTDDIAVPDGHYNAPDMSITIVPNRNAILLAIAFAAAVARNADIVGVGVHSGDHVIYPDCRPLFVQQFAEMERTATDRDIDLFAPFLYNSKAEIVARGVEMGLDYRHTWSCYKGGEFHCGTCGTCIERREAFSLAGASDPTFYLA